MNFVEPIRDKDDIQSMKDYLKAWNERNYMMFLLGINSGLRISDIINLRVKDVGSIMEWIVANAKQYNN